MPDRTPFLLNPRRRRAMLLWAAADTALGLVLLLAPPARVSSHAFDPAKRLAPMPWWGLVAAVLGLVWLYAAAIAPRIPWPRAATVTSIPAALLAGWHVFFWLSLCFAAAATPTVGLTGCVIYFAVAGNHILFAADQV